MLAHKDLTKIWKCTQCSRMAEVPWHKCNKTQWRCDGLSYEKRGDGGQVEHVCEGSMKFSRQMTAKYGGGLKTVRKADREGYVACCSVCLTQRPCTPFGETCQVGACNGYMILLRDSGVME